MPSLPARPSGTAAWEEIGGASMGTTWTVRLVGRNLQKPGSAIQSALDALVDQMSTWEANSVISVLNRAERGWYQIPAEFFHVLHQALELAAQTGGAYDPAFGRLTDLWGFGPQGFMQTPPAQIDIDAALAQSGWQRSALNHKHRAVWQPGGLQFDLSAIAKGYGVDEIARVLNEHGIEHYLVELGGELKARGLGPRATRWKVDIEDPDQSGANLPVLLANCALATSGDYRRCFYRDGQRYAHTLDTHTGHPLRHTVESVSVMHAQCMMADGLATALLSLGLEKGLAYARRHRIAALFMSREEQGVAIEMTDEFKSWAGERQ